MVTSTVGTPGADILLLVEPLPRECKQIMQGLKKESRLAFEGVRCSFMFSQACWRAGMYKAGKADAAEEHC